MQSENRTSSPTPRSYAIRTFGCKANLYDSQLIEAELQKRGYTPAKADEEPEITFVNSCTVTNEADIQSKKAARLAARDNPNTRVVFTGCGAEVEPEKYLDTPGLSFVVGNQNKDKIVDLVLGAIRSNPIDQSQIIRPHPTVLGTVTDYQEILSRHPMDREWPTPESSFMLPPASMELNGESSRTRTFIKVQEGCDSFCTYCIIPYGRGPARSPKISFLVDQVHELVKQGTREVVITGTNIGDYGVDWSEDKKPRIEDLVEAILNETKLERLRVSSLDPVEISPRMIEIMKSNPRFMPHFHVSLQSANTAVLRLMKRKYGAHEVETCLNSIASIPAPHGGVFVGMDVITGFPGETDEHFEDTLLRLKSLPWSRLHVFPYSEREGTPATRLPHKIQNSVRVERARILRELSLERLKSIHQHALIEVKKTGRGFDRVLMEGVTTGPTRDRVWVGGYSSNYLRVLVAVDSTEKARSIQNQTLDGLSPESVFVDSNQGDVAFITRL